jgi:transcriptional regulator with XRE-family HTH domain
MKADFSRTLSLLRQEKGLSQRQVAAGLGISQALLSHYENGVREPGLAFVGRACDFYGVSADFLLGRTLSRDGTTILDADSLYDSSQERDNVLRGSVMATLAKKLIVNSVGVLFDLLGRLGSRQAVKSALNVLGGTVYTLYRHLCRVSPDYKEEMFSVSDSCFVTGLARVDLILSESEYVQALQLSREKKEPFPPLDHPSMAGSYPGTYQSLLQVIHTCGERANGQLARYRELDK